MPSTDITEFVKVSRQNLIDAIGRAGVPAEELREICHKAAPFGSWKLPVIFFAYKKPVAKYFLTYPTVDGKKSVKFNIETFEHISKWLNPQQPSPQNSSNTMENPSSS